VLVGGEIKCWSEVRSGWSEVKENWFGELTQPACMDAFLNLKVQGRGQVLVAASHGQVR
jgi:hypothetical protein